MERAEGGTSDGLWSDRVADDVLQNLPEDRREGPIVCASGISPSGPIHMGNLREAFTTHLVVEALRDRGHDAVHLHSWDDYDRLRKVPAGIDESFGKYVGMPLAEIPDPAGEHPSWADRYMSDFLESTSALGIEMHGVRQSVQYRSGVYNAAIRRAMDERGLVFDILAEQQTAGRHDAPAEERRAKYFPFKPYCEECGKDDTSVVAYDEPVVTYRCRHGHDGTMSLADGEPIRGKLVWKVDWPMRWHHERVTFEPAGEDHHAPQGSFTVGRSLIERVYGGRAPDSVVYSFVKMAGMGAKMSSSAGGAAVPAAALQILEPAIVRWMYIRRLPNQGFAIDLKPGGVQRLYDEWDGFVARATGPAPDVAEAVMHRHATRTTAGDVETSRRPVSFRLLSSVADLTQANREQIGRIVASHLDEEVDLDELEPRLTCAINFATEHVEPEDRTVVRDAFDEEAWGSLDEQTRAAIERLADGLAGSWSIDALTTLVYAVPKQTLGVALDADPTPEIKKAQREFFKAVYRLLVGKEKGPRIPTLLLSIGPERARELLGAASTRVA